MRLKPYFLGLTTAAFILSLNFTTSTNASEFAEKSKMAYLKQVGEKPWVVVREFDSQLQKYIEKDISDKNQDAYHPEMSPLGDSVAYSIGTIRPGKEVNIQLVIQNLNDQSLEEWSEKADQYIHVEFSGNAQYLVFSGPNPKNQKQNIGIIDLFLERAKGPVKTELRNGKRVSKYQPNVTYIDSPYDCYAPAVSSNGKMIIYHRTLDSSSKLSPKELVQYDVETKSKKLISEKGGHAMFPSLSSDDRHVAFVSKTGEQWDIHRLDLWTGETNQVTLDENIEFTPVFAPDNSIYFTRFDQNSLGGEIDIYHLTPHQVFHSRSYPTPTAFIKNENVADYVPSFSGIKDYQLEVLPSFPKPERSSFGAITHNNKTYIVGGHQGPEHTYPKESFLNRVDIYDHETKSWKQAASMNIPKHGFEMATYGNYIYAFGGFAYSEKHKPAWQSLEIIERYDVSKDKWEVLATKLPRRRSSNVAVQVEGKVFLIGGWDSTPKFDGDKEGRFHSEIDVFDLVSETINIATVTLSAPKRRAFSATVHEDKIYLLGGITEGASHFDWLDHVTVLDTSTMTFREEAKLPYATFAPGAGFIKDKLFFIGGMVLKNASTFDLDYVDDIYQFDLATKKWTHLGKFLQENKGFPQVVELKNDALGILGGHTYIKDETGRIIDHPVDSFESLKLIK